MNLMKKAIGVALSMVSFIFHPPGGLPQGWDSLYNNKTGI
jgi:hypothetical protein